MVGNVLQDFGIHSIVFFFNLFQIWQGVVWNAWFIYLTSGNIPYFCTCCELELFYLGAHPVYPVQISAIIMYVIWQPFQIWHPEFGKTTKISYSICHDDIGPSISQNVSNALSYTLLLMDGFLSMLRIIGLPSVFVTNIFIIFSFSFAHSDHIINNKNINFIN